MFKRILSFVLTLSVLLTVFGVQTSAQEAGATLNTVVVISDSNDVKTGQVITGKNDNQKVTVQKYCVENFTESLNSVTCIDMDSFYESDVARKSEIQDILTQEFNNDKKIVFFGSSEALNPADVYKMLGLTPTYSFDVVPSDKSKLSSENATYTYSNITDNLVGFSVEKLDVGVNVVNYFYSYDENTQTKIDALSLMVNTSSANLAQQSEIHDISTQYTVVGTGYTDWTTIPVIYSASSKWMAQFVLYLARTDFINNNTSNTKTYWQFTSQINMTHLSGGDQIYALSVINDCNFDSQNLIDYSPDTTINNTSQSYSISVGMNDQGAMNVGVGISETISKADVQVVPHYDPVAGCCIWGYSYAPGSLVSYNGNKSIQQIEFTNTYGWAYAQAGFGADFGTWFGGVFGIGAGWTKQDGMPLNVLYVIGMWDIQ